MEPLETLLAIEALKQLKAAYCRLVDAQDWSGFGALFAPEAVLVPPGSVGTVEPASIQGSDSIAAWVAGKLDGAMSVHQAFLPEIELDSPSSAKGIWAMEDRVEWKDRRLHGFGHYHERYILTESGWRISSLELVRTRFSICTRSSPRPA